jgi:hypothetical protein
MYGVRGGEVVWDQWIRSFREGVIGIRGVGWERRQSLTIYGLDRRQIYDSPTIRPSAFRDRRLQRVITETARSVLSHSARCGCGTVMVTGGA